MARGMRTFWDAAVEDMRSGRHSWRVMALLGSGALAVSALYTLW